MEVLEVCCNDAGLSKNPTQLVVQLHPVMMQYRESASSMCNLQSCIILVKKKSETEGH